ncbi:hypothetical protein [Mesorhizobium sp.]|uniref:hypothetical protein n=1 Tax=Mesorhizobium sp. TaxID=1871066 RepID=UPI000FE80E13|nr:hypothetical protein [Mesorhizobium sp.]RWM28157.1 MAG: hypothetical protein EOR74_10185 [Mesorhizobium sp.]RWM41403.1 MAG: hypothetical protein EOR75_04705 [Mesorhizobium sp.]TJV54384.1 MAG: hypothetical protein E5Y01_02630 [Mesorhizobium sp.]
MMLARRFGLVCVMAAVVGVVLSIIVSQPKSDGLASRRLMFSPCAYPIQPSCQAEAIHYFN